MKLMWSSNGSWTSSGYGIFTRDFLTRLKKLNKYEFAQLAFWGLTGHPAVVDGFKTYPVMGHPFGADAVYHHSKHFGADYVFTMQDVHTLDPEVLKRIKWIPYCPVDKFPVPGSVLGQLRHAHKIVSFSKFGHESLLKEGFVSTLIPEGVDTEIFKPLNKKLELRLKYKIPPGAFLFLMVAANKENPPRKGFQEALEAFAMFAKDHPEAAMFIHTQQRDPGGFPIREFAHHLGVLDRLFFMDDYTATFIADSTEVNEEMNMADVLLHPSQTEGFGLTVTEAQSAGIPVLINNTTSMPELIVEGKTGEMCKTTIPRFTNDCSYVYPADSKDLAHKMEVLYQKLKLNPEQIAKDCRNHIVENYNIDKIFDEKWVPFLAKLEKELTTS